MISAQPLRVPDDPATVTAWFEELYAAVTGLVARYPTALGQRIRTGWWEHPAASELLAAICAWRCGLDEINDSLDGAPEQRGQAEWAFHQQLDAWGAYLSAQGDERFHPFSPSQDAAAIARFLAQVRTTARKR